MTIPSEAPVDLARPGSQQSVQLWVDVPANNPGVPLRSVPASPPQVIFAQHKPRLTAPELRARQGAVTRPAPSVSRPGLTVVAPPKVQPPRLARVADRRVARWLMLLALALTAVAAAPLS